MSCRSLAPEAVNRLAVTRVPSGLWFPFQPGTTLAAISGCFPVRHLITAVLALFNLPAGTNPWAGHAF